MLAENMPPTPVVDVQPSESEVRLSKLVRRHVARWAARVRRHVRDSALYTSAWPRDMRQVRCCALGSGTPWAHTDSWFN